MSHKGRPLKPRTSLDIEIIAWYKARKALGTQKTLARKLGIPVSQVEGAIDRMHSRERRQRLAMERRL